MRRLPIVLAAAVLLAGCEPYVQVTRAPGVRIAAGSGWAWSNADADGPSSDAGLREPPDTIADILATALEEALGARGFPRVAPESAAFFVHFHVAQRLVTDTLPPRSEPDPDRIAGRWGAYGRPEELDGRIVTWTEGTLVIDMMNPKGIVAWRGIIAGEVEDEVARDPRSAIHAGVARLLDRFP